MNILKKTILIAGGLGTMGCANIRESGVITYKQELPEENALYVKLDRDTLITTKLFFYDAELDRFNAAQSGDRIVYVKDNRGCYIDVGYNGHVRKIIKDKTR